MEKIVLNAKDCEEYVYFMNDLNDKETRYGSLPDIPLNQSLISNLTGARKECTEKAAAIFGQIGENFTVPQRVENMEDDEFQNLPIKKFLDSLQLNGHPMFQDTVITQENFYASFLKASEKIVKAVTSDVDEKEIPYVRDGDNYKAITPSYDPAAASVRPPFYKRLFQGIVPRWKEDVNKYNTALKYKERGEKLEKKVEEKANAAAANRNAPSRNENANTDSPARRLTNLNELGGARMSQSRKNSPARGNNAREPLSRREPEKQAPAKQTPAGRKR